MRFVLNNLTAVRRKTGIGHYVTELVRCLRDRDDRHQFVTFPGPWIEAGVHAWKRVRERLPLSNKGRSARSADNPPLKNWVNARARGWAAWHFRTFWSGKSFDLYHEPNYIPLPFDGPTVATVHDLSVILHPEWHPRDRVAYYANHFEAGLGRCDHLLVPSEFTRRELINSFHVSPTKVTCTPLGMRADLRPLPMKYFQPVLQRLSLPDSYLLHVGTIEPRKNLLMLMSAYTDLPGHVRARCPLVLVGGWGWNGTAISNYFQSAASRQGVRLLGYVADADLAALYSAARALVFPSHYEGFGLPPLEMLACGGAVIASTAGAVAETISGHACLVNAEDLEGWRDAMHRVITDDEWRESLCQGGREIAHAYTWRRCADQTFHVYQQILGIATSRLSGPMRASA